MENHNPKRQTAEGLVTSAVNSVKHATEEKIRRVEIYTRESPLAALAVASATGYVLRSLPVRALLGLVVRLSLVLVRPFIFVFGAVNIYQFFRGRFDSQDGSGRVEEYTPGEAGKGSE